VKTTDVLLLAIIHFQFMSDRITINDVKVITAEAIIKGRCRKNQIGKPKRV
jgi:hypothetical protein